MGLTCLPYFIIDSYIYLQSWEALPQDSRTFSSDITPLILAAHLNHFEIVRMLLDRGANLPVPHDVRYWASLYFHIIHILFSIFQFQ